MSGLVIGEAAVREFLHQGSTHTSLCHKMGVSTRWIQTFLITPKTCSAGIMPGISTIMSQQTSGEAWQEGGHCSHLQMTKLRHEKVKPLA